MNNRRLIVITNSTLVENETIWINLMFHRGLNRLHLRRPGASEEEFRAFIEAIDSSFWKRIVVHDHFSLVREYGLAGIHLSSSAYPLYRYSPDHGSISVSCHQFEEVEQLKDFVDYCFLSPIYDSISKEGYRAGFDYESLRSKLAQITVPVFALGGIDPTRIGDVISLGFRGYAVLGYIWSKPWRVLEHFTELSRPGTLIFAGLDSSGGAGLIADVKTVEHLGGRAYGVCTAITCQNEFSFDSLVWLPAEQIENQANSIFSAAKDICIVKIGIVKDLEMLMQIIDLCEKCLPSIPIIWDPVVKSSTEFPIFNEFQRSSVDAILKRITFLTPNCQEFEYLFGGKSPEQLAEELELNHFIVLKGGHSSEINAVDRIIGNGKVVTSYLYRTGTDKHGTGCTFSSALSMAFAKGYLITDAVSMAQNYTSKFREETTQLVAPQPRDVDLKNKRNPNKTSLMLITDGSPEEIIRQTQLACMGGCRWVQLRMKDVAPAIILETGRVVREICHAYNATFIVNDSVDLAWQLQADGVHLGQNDGSVKEARMKLGEKAIVGRTCNTTEHILNASQERADYVGMGPFRFTTTKKNLSPILGLEGYRNVVQFCREQHISLPIFAIGGITLEDLQPLMATGIQGVAISSLINRNASITECTKQIIKLLHNE